MSINHTKLKKLLALKKYTYQEIADIVSCNITTVDRMAKKYNLQKGQGVKNYWEFSENSVFLSYLLGIVLTDGSIGKGYKNNKPNLVSVFLTTPEIINHSSFCFGKIGLKTTVKKINHGEGHLGKKEAYRLSNYSSMFALWLSNITCCKSIIPDFTFTSNAGCQLAFLAGIIDGDGMVSRHH